MTWKTQITNDPYIQQLLGDNPEGMKILLGIVEKTYLSWYLEHVQESMKKFYE